MSLADPVLLAVGLLVAAGLAWAAVVVARRRTAAKSSGETSRLRTRAWPIGTLPRAMASAPGSAALSAWA